MTAHYHSPVNDLNQDLGFYEVDSIKFSSKINALLYASKTGKGVSWNFNRDVFDNYNWSIEPVESLKELYFKRARQLREKYDYIVMSYSAGADSTNVLESFIQQNLHIDEILVSTTEGANKTIVNDAGVKSNLNYGAEYKLQIYPRLHELAQRIPQTKINVVDVSGCVFERFKDVKDESWIIGQKEHLNPTALYRFNYLWEKDIKKRFDKSCSIGYVLGVDKPITFIEQNKFYLTFVDHMVNIAPAESHIEDYDNTKIEYFYWSPDSVDMICKQAHTIKKWLDINKQYVTLWTPSSRKDLLYNHRTIQQLLRTIIYDTWNTDWFQADKDTRSWFAEIDNWWYVLYHDTQEYKTWMSGLTYLKNNIGNYLNCDANNLPLSLQGFWSKKYYVGNIDESSLIYP